MYNYLQLDNLGNVIGVQMSALEISSEDAGSTAILQIPAEPNPYLGYRYLQSVVPGVTVLGEDFNSELEAPPAPGCYWDGTEWVCPDAAVAE